MKAVAFIPALLLPLVAGAETPVDPWSLVPQAPTVCYTTQDQFSDNIAEALETLDEMRSTQGATNDAISHQVSDMANADPMQVAQHMQAYMMEHPQDAAKMMQNLQTMGQTYTSSVVEDQESEQHRQEALDGLIVDYKSADAAISDALEKRMAALPTVETEAGTALADEAALQFPDISRQGNAAYDSLCAKWWKDGPFAEWLAEYRDYLTERVARQMDVAEQSRLQWEIQGIDTSDFRPTADMDAARDYSKRQQQIYDLRRATPLNLHFSPGGFAYY
jgi:hypothetical protein